MSKSILVVEDDALSQFVMVEMCKELGFDCLVANDGQECIEIVEENGKDIGLILMDIHMPKVSGLVATTTIRAHPNNPPNGLPIIATTADVQYQNPDVCGGHGFTDVIPKPIGFQRLAETVKQFKV